jgi:hypothetical protein
VVIRNQFKSFNLAICDCFAISCHHVRISSCRRGSYPIALMRFL